MKKNHWNHVGATTLAFGILATTFAGANAAQPSDSQLAHTSNIYAAGQAATPIGEAQIQQKLKDYIDSDGYDYGKVLTPFKRIATGTYSISYENGALIYIQDIDEIYYMTPELYAGYKTVANWFGAPIVKSEMLNGRISFVNGYALRYDRTTGKYLASREFIDSRGAHYVLYTWTFTA